MLTVSVDWLEGGNVGVQVVFHDDGTVDIAVQDVAMVPIARWDAIRSGVLVATSQEELAEVFRGTPLGASFAHGERLVNVGAMVALHAFAPDSASLVAVVAMVGEALASQYGGTIFSDDRQPPHYLFVLPTPVEAERGALAELYRAGRLHRLSYRVVAQGQTPREWSTFFVPFHSPAITPGQVSDAAFDLSGRIHSAITALIG